MRDPNFFCLCPVFVVNPVVLMYKKVLRPFSTSSTETQVMYILGLTISFPLQDHTVRSQDTRFVYESRKNRLSDLRTLERWHQRDTPPAGMGRRTVVPRG